MFILFSDFTMSYKYSDNGGVKAEDELNKYFRYYNNQRNIQDKLNLDFLRFKSSIKNKLNKNIVFKFKTLLRH